jgi:hypothetical protein
MEERRGEERCIHGFGGGTLRETDPAVDGRIILTLIFRKLDRRA